jgi:prenyltransferase beta subunit
MLQVARLAPKQLGEARELVEAFFRSQLHPSGGFCDRAGKPDLYYTVFGIEGLIALGAVPPVEQCKAYLRTFGEGESLDFVHLCCLARCWAGVKEGAPAGLPGRIALHPVDTAYEALLSYSAHQDLGAEYPGADQLLRIVEGLKAGDEAYGNWPGMPRGMTSATAAVVALHRQLDRVPDQRLGAWLMQQWRPEGGFTAAPEVALPDLLSTATALHALAGLQIPLEPIREATLDFLDTLWTNRGGFHGNWTDDDLDCEYTYYGLLSLGHLTV